MSDGLRNRSGEGRVRVRRVRFECELYNILDFTTTTISLTHHHHRNSCLGF